jgi:hypothetical protein
MGSTMSRRLAHFTASTLQGLPTARRPAALATRKAGTPDTHEVRTHATTVTVTRLKRARFVSAVAIILLCGLALPLAASAQTPPPELSSLLVKLVAGLSSDEQAAVIARNGGVEVSSIPALRLHVVEVLTADLATVLANYQGDFRIAHVGENKVRRAEALPSDPL